MAEFMNKIKSEMGYEKTAYLLLTGDVAAVSAAIERAKTAVGEDGMLLDSTVIPNPDKGLWNTIL